MIELWTSDREDFGLYPSLVSKLLPPRYFFKVMGSECSPSVNFVLKGPYISLCIGVSHLCLSVGVSHLCLSDCECLTFFLSVGVSYPSLSVGVLYLCLSLYLSASLSVGV